MTGWLVLAWLTWLMRLLNERDATIARLTHERDEARRSAEPLGALQHMFDTWRW